MADDVRHQTTWERLGADGIAVICILALLYASKVLLAGHGLVAIVMIVAGIGSGLVAAVLLYFVLIRWVR